MALETIILAICVVSFAGAALILARKIPVLRTLPQDGTSGIRNYHVIARVENKLRAISLAIEKQIFLHKVLSWVKVITLKIEVKIDHLLHGIRKKAQKIDQDINKKK